MLMNDNKWLESLLKSRTLLKSDDQSNNNNKQEGSIKRDEGEPCLDPLSLDRYSKTGFIRCLPWIIFQGPACSDEGMLANGSLIKFLS
jgi:hypothetical protein